MVKQTEIDAIAAAMGLEEGEEAGKLLLEETGNIDLSALKGVANKLTNVSSDSPLLVALTEKLSGMSDKYLTQIQEANILILSDMASQIIKNRVDKQLLAEGIEQSLTKESE